MKTRRKTICSFQNCPSNCIETHQNLHHLKQTQNNLDSESLLTSFDIQKPELRKHFSRKFYSYISLEKFYYYIPNQQFKEKLVKFNFVNQKRDLKSFQKGSPICLIHYFAFCFVNEMESVKNGISIILFQLL